MDKRELLNKIIKNPKLLKVPDVLNYCMKDKEFVCDLVSMSSVCLRLLPEILKSDNDVIRSAVEIRPYLLKEINWGNKDLDDKCFILSLIELDYKCLEHIPEKWKNNKNIVLFAVKQNPNALVYAPQKLRSDKEVVLAAVKECGGMLEFASKRLRDNKEIVLAAIKENSDVLRIASERLRDDIEVVLIAVKNNKARIDDASERIREICAGKDPLNVLLNLKVHKDLSEEYKDIQKLKTKINKI